MTAARRAFARRRRCPAAPAIGVLLLAAVGRAEPALERVEPPVGQCGTEVQIQLGGTDLGEPRELVFEEGRIAVTALEGKQDTSVVATLRIPADCPPGPQRLRLRTAGGLSDLRVFHVQAAPVAGEREPNAAAASATPLAAGTSAWGTLDNGDVDVYRVSLPAGGRIAAVVDAIRLDQSMLDPHLELVAADGTLLAASDDHPLTAPDAALAATVPVAGDYFLRVREAAHGGAKAAYVLHAGDFPLAHQAWPPGGAPGATLEIEWRGDPAGPFRQAVTLPAADADGLARVHPVRDGRAGALAVPLRVTTAPVVTIGPGDDEPERATAVTAPVAIAGCLERADDVDWIRVAAPAGSRWRVIGRGRRLGSPVDLVVAAHHDTAKRDRITSNDDAAGCDSQIELASPAEGAFLLRVDDFRQRGGADFIYWLDVEQAPPGATVSVPPAQSRTRQRLVPAVPRGNRTALVFNAARNQCPDPLRLGFAGLPAGVTATGGRIAEPAAGGVVVFEAAADAACGQALAAVQVLPEPEGAEAVGGLRQVTEMVFGEPNRTPYRSIVCDRLAVAVIDEVPVTIEVAPPPNPLVRRGRLDLAVTVTRGTDFGNALRLELPFKPPGVGASQVEVKGDRTTVPFPVSAAADAAVGEWTIAVAALIQPARDKERRPGGRSVAGTWIASRPVTLAVAEPLVEFAAARVAAERGGTATLVLKAAKPARFSGRARATLTGLPVHVAAPPCEFGPEAETIAFPLTVGPDAPVGRHDSVVCRIEVPLGDALVAHETTGISLRIDTPLPGAVAAAPTP